MKSLELLIFPLIVCLFLPAVSSAQNGKEMSGDAGAIMERILLVDSRQREAVRDVVFDVEALEGKMEDDDQFVEEAKFIKKIYLKYLMDTTLIHEEYLEYFESGELQPEKKMREQADERLEKKQKRKSKDISYSMLTPFYPENRELYDISYEGVAPDLINGHRCHHFHVKATKDDDQLINGEFYFETDGFNLVQVDFTPAKLVKKMMFKLKKLDMRLQFEQVKEGFWLPFQFDIEGKGKAALFVGVNFAGTEYYRNPVINGGIEDSIFEVQNGEHF